MTYLQKFKAVQELVQNTNHFDVKIIEGDVTIREFIAGALSYHPRWIKALYAIRWGFVRLLGMKQENMAIPNLKSEDIPFTKGEWATFFQVYEAQENQYWIASASDKHLTAYLIVANEPLSNGKTCFHLATIVHYHNWAGPIYFNVIRPFHHIVTRSMMKAGIRYSNLQGNVNYA